jgi:hypothetical protein
LYTADDLILAVQEAATLPEDDERFTESELLRIADTETLAKVLPLVKRHVGGYLSYDKNYAISTSGRYRIPARAVMGALLDVKLTNGDEEVSIPVLEEHDVMNRTLSPFTYACFVKNNSVYTLPRSIAGYTGVRLTYMLRPSNLILESAAGLVTGIDTATGIVTCSSVPTGFSSGLLDIVRGEPQAEVLAIDQDPEAVVTGASGTVEFSELPDDLEVGDFIAPAGESPVVLLPRELVPLLEQLVANHCLKSQTDQAAIAEGRKNEKELREGASILMTPRVQHQPKRLVPRHGLMRRR